MKKITVLGVTGSIGMQTVDVVMNHPEQFKITAMAAGYNVAKVEEILAMIDVEYICMVKKEDALYLQEKYPDLKVVYGESGLIEIATLPEIEIVLNAIVGFAGLVPTIEAIKAKIPRGARYMTYRMTVMITSLKSTIIWKSCVSGWLCKYLFSAKPKNNAKTII